MCAIFTINSNVFVKIPIEWYSYLLLLYSLSCNFASVKYNMESVITKINIMEERLNHLINNEEEVGNG